jgi:hypothetical protein
MQWNASLLEFGGMVHLIGLQASNFLLFQVKKHKPSNHFTKTVSNFTRKRNTTDPQNPRNSVSWDLRNKFSSPIHHPLSGSKSTTSPPPPTSTKTHKTDEISW